MNGSTQTLLAPPYWFWLLLVLNCVVVAVYWLVRRAHPTEQAASFRLRCLVMLLCPLAGPVFFFFGWLYLRVFFHKPVDLDDVIFSKDQTKTYLMADEDRERNFVPLEEAIAVTDQANTRILMMEVIRRDISNSLSSISLALGSDDSEVSHYAASVLQETMDGLRLSFQKLWHFIRDLEAEVAQHDTEEAPLRLSVEPEPQQDVSARRPDASEEDEELPENAVNVSMYREEQRIQRNKEESYRQGLLARDGAPDPATASINEKLRMEIEAAHTLMGDLKQILWQKVLSPQEQESYTDMMEELAALIDRRDMLTAYELESLTAALLRQEEFARCQAWCSRSMELYPLALSSFTGRLRLCFSLGDREGFFEVMDELKRADVSLDHETLEMVRVFL